MLTILYDIIITPLIYLISFFYSILYSVSQSPGLSIIGISLIVNVLCTPLYQMADEAQQKERARQQEMSHWVDHIKRHFSGDEQYMMLSEYYRQQHYHPIQAFSGTITLLLQIPFFIAAYHYLSNLELLKASSFLFLQDLGAQDGLITLEGLSINVMPILMTLLNLASTYAYTRDLPMRDRIQSYGLAAVFLFLLYRSPSGLVLYWTCNQIYSLCKNLLKMWGHARTVSYALVEALFVLIAIFLYREGLLINAKRVLLVLACGALLQLPMVIRLIPKRQVDTEESFQPMQVTGMFVLAALLAAATVGLVIPATLIGSSPDDFIELADFINPMTYILHTSCVAIGLFCLWIGVFFFLGGKKFQRWFAIIMVMVAVTGLLNYFSYGKNFGIITESLTYETLPTFDTRGQIINLLLNIAAIIVVAFVGIRFPKLLNPIMAILLVSLIGSSVPDLMDISRTAREAQEQIESSGKKKVGALFAPTDNEGNPVPIINLSTEGKNVIVVFFDRGIGLYVPYIINEKPELAERLDGFTYYPNTLSHGIYTLFGSPGLYGGYEYVPSVMNSRTKEPIFDKEIESIEVLPAIFSEAGYQTTLVNPTIDEMDSDLTTSDGLKLEESLATFFDQRENRNLYYTTGVYSTQVEEEQAVVSEQNLRRSFCLYGMFKTAPAWLQPIIYDEGQYQSTLVNHAHRKMFIRYYAEMTRFPDMVQIEEGAGNSFTSLRYMVTHTPEELQLPNYTPKLFLHNEGLFDKSLYTLGDQTLHMENDAQITHYQTNMAALLILAEWFDYMRDEGVYDNTRIIIVSDHGRELSQSDALKVNGELDAEGVNPILMVKDFDAHGFSTDESFMTNADTPTLALQGLIENPINPFTGNPIDSSYKDKHEQEVTLSHNWHTFYHLGSQFDTSDKSWYSVHDDIFNPSNWSKIEPAQN